MCFWFLETTYSFYWVYGLSSNKLQFDNRYQESATFLRQFLNTPTQNLICSRWVFNPTTILQCWEEKSTMMRFNGANIPWSSARHSSNEMIFESTANSNSVLWNSTICAINPFHVKISWTDEDLKVVRASVRLSKGRVATFEEIWIHSCDRGGVHCASVTHSELFFEYWLWLILLFIYYLLDFLTFRWTRDVHSCQLQLSMHHLAKKPRFPKTNRTGAILAQQPRVWIVEWLQKPTYF